MSHRAELRLPGWFCFGCQIFNGEAKAERFECRSCGAPAPIKGNHTDRAAGNKRLAKGRTA